MLRQALLGFLAGFLAVLIFHQGVGFLMHHLTASVPEARQLLGQVPPPYRMAPVPPFGVPAVLSSAFWGGVWGVLLALLLRNGALPDLLFGFLFGAVALPLVGFTLVAYLKGLPLFGGGNPASWLRSVIYNGTWGWGTALILRSLGTRPRA